MTIILSIAWNTLIKCIRQPVFALVTLSVIPAVLISIPLCICRTMNVKFVDSDQMMFVNLTISTIQVISFFLAVICASSVISGEIQDKTALTIISKPTARWQFVLGKYLGIQAAVILGYCTGVTVLLLALRHQVTSYSSAPVDWPVIVLGFLAFFMAIGLATFANYFFRWNFCATLTMSCAIFFTIALLAVFFIGKDWSAGTLEDSFGPSKINWNVGKAIIMIFYSVFIMTAFIVAASTRFSTLQTIVASGVFFSAGVLHEWYINGMVTSGLNVHVVTCLDALLPNFNIFEPYNSISKQIPIPTILTGTLAIYSATYTTVLILGGVLLFQGRELTGKTSIQTSPEPVAILCGLLKLYAIGAIIAGFATCSTETGWKGYTYPIIFAFAALLLWLFSVGVTNGRRWAWYIVLIPATIELARCLSVLLFPGYTQSFTFGMADRGIIIISAVATGGIIILLLIPKTRHYFRSQSQSV